MGQPISRNTVKKTLIVIVCLAAAIIVTKLYLKTIGVLIFLAALIYAVLSFRQFFNEKKALSEAREKPDRIPIGKTVQFLQYVIYGLIAVALIRLFIGQSYR